MGLTVQGKIPLRYASSKRGVDKSPSMAMSPSRSARRGSGKLNRWFNTLIMDERAPSSRLTLARTRRVFHAQRVQKRRLKITRGLHGENVRGIGLVDFGNFEFL